MMFQHNNINDWLSQLSDPGAPKVVAMVCPGDPRFTEPKSLKNLVLHLAMACKDRRIIFLVADGQLQEQTRPIIEASNTGKSSRSPFNAENWERKYRNLFDEHLPGVKVFCWDEVVTKHSDYMMYIGLARGEYVANEDFKKALDESADAYIRMRFKLSVDDIVDRTSSVWMCAHEYKIMETAGLYVKAALGFDFLVYPGHLCPGLEYALEHLVKEHFPGKLEFKWLNPDSMFQEVSVVATQISHAANFNAVVEGGRLTDGVQVYRQSGDGFEPPYDAEGVMTQLRFLLTNVSSVQELAMLTLQIRNMTEEFLLQAVASQSGSKPPPKKPSAKPVGTSMIADGHIVYNRTTEPVISSTSQKPPTGVLARDVDLLLPENSENGAGAGAAAVAYSLPVSFLPPPPPPPAALPVINDPLSSEVAAVPSRSTSFTSLIKQ